MSVRRVRSNKITSLLDIAQRYRRQPRDHPNSPPERAIPSPKRDFRGSLFVSKETGRAYEAYSMRIVGTHKTTQTLVCCCCAEPKRRIHDRSMMRIDRARSDRENKALRHAAAAAASGRFGRSRDPSRCESM